MNNEEYWITELQNNNILDLNNEEIIAFADYIYQCQPGLESWVIWNIIENREYEIIKDENKEINPINFLQNFLSDEYLKETQNDNHWANYYYYSKNGYWIFECPT